MLIQLVKSRKKAKMICLAHTRVTTAELVVYASHCTYTHCNIHTCVCFLIRFSFLPCQLLIRCTLLLLSSRLVELGCHPGPGARGHCWGFCVAACDHKDNRISCIPSMTTMSHMTGVASIEMVPLGSTAKGDAAPLRDGSLTQTICNTNIRDV